MKIKQLTAIITGILIFADTSKATAATCQQTTCPGNILPSNNYTSVACKGGNYSWYCYYDYQGNLKGPFENCPNGCADNYSFEDNSSFVSKTLKCTTGTLNAPATCVTNASLCGECESTTWSEIPSIPYARRTKKYCDGPTCKSETEIGCKKGYYGTPTAIGTGCTQCPSSGGVSGTTDTIGAHDITECYLPAGSKFSDSTGNGTYSEKCYYTN